MNGWATDDDFTRDIQACSIFSNENCVARAKQPNERMRKARTKVSIYEEDFSSLEPASNGVEDDVEYCKPVRGRPLHSPLLRPVGGKPSFLQNQKETTVDIRNVTQVGYSNDLIEIALKEMPIPKSERKLGIPNIRLKSRSNNTTATNSPQNLSSRSTSPSSTKSTPFKDVNENTSYTVRSDFTENLKNMNGTVDKITSPPPPLYDIIKGKSRRKNVAAKSDIENSESKYKSCMKNAATDPDIDNSEPKCKTEPIMKITNSKLTTSLTEKMNTFFNIDKKKDTSVPFSDPLVDKFLNGSSESKPPINLNSEKEFPPLR